MAAEPQAAAATNPTAGPPRRRWYRLHVSTWLLLIAAAAVWLLLNIPGDEPDEWIAWHGNRFVHGFPATYLVRVTSEWPYFIAPRETLNPWRLADGISVFSPAALFFDAIFGIAALTLFACFLEWRRRKRKIYQFTLRELLIITAVCAVCLDWWRIQRDHESEVVKHLAALRTSTPTDTSQKLEPRMPRWCRDLVGDDQLLKLSISKPVPCFVHWRSESEQHLKSVLEFAPNSFCLDVTGNQLESDLDKISELNLLRQVSFQECNDRVVARLAKLTSLEVLCIDSFENDVKSANFGLWSCRA